MSVNPLMNAANCLIAKDIITERLAIPATDENIQRLADCISTLESGSVTS